MLAKKSCTFNGLKIVPALAQWKIYSHQSQLRLHCRLCGERVKRARSGRATREYACSDLAAEIHSEFGICVANDNKCIHPTSLCRSCHDALKRKKTQSITVFEWHAHDKEECSVSKHPYTL